jgi:hypothetical protein
MMHGCAPPKQAMERTRGDTVCHVRASVAAGRSSLGR